MIRLTAGLLDGLKTPRGGYNQATLAHLGVAWPPQEGWKRRMIGTEISERHFYAAVRAKDRPERHRFRGNTRGKHV